MVKECLESFFGKPVFQPLWEALHKLSLHRMNFGRGATLEKSGEKWVLDYLAEKMKDRSSIVIFDVGAHVGDYAAEAIGRFEGKALLYCFEPAGTSFDKVNRRFEGSENVKTFRFGFSDNEERLSLYTNKAEPSLASLYERNLDHCGIEMEYSEEIQLKRLDDFCAAEGIGHIDFLKLDVEGHELKVLNGAANMLSKEAIDFIQFEFGDCNIDSRTYFRDFFYLLNPHCRIHRILKKGIQPITEYNERYEIFKVTNYLAISRRT